MMQCYQIAGLRVQMDTFGRTLAQAEAYRCAPFAQADITLSSDWRPLKEGRPDLSEEECGYIVSGAEFYSYLVRFDGMMLHASAVVLDGRAYLFTAPSGTGKSTHTQLWQKVFGDRAKILNDDKPALRLENGTWYAYGTPWSGKTDLNLNIRVPLAGICVLSRGAENRITPCTTRRAIHTILEQTLRLEKPGFMGKLLRVLDLLVTDVPVWQMECNMDPEAAVISYSAMSGERKDV